ncbi:hypothetical protein KBD11_02195, partial [Candidatus Saccharibacteria bacterium]|nr:hypothetical protein [Candidatus Saccharibacteria bacterium]
MLLNELHAQEKMRKCDSAIRAAATITRQEIFDSRAKALHARNEEMRRSFGELVRTMTSHGSVTFEIALGNSDGDEYKAVVRPGTHTVAFFARPLDDPQDYHFVVDDQISTRYSLGQDGSGLNLDLSPGGYHWEGPGNVRHYLDLLSLVESAVDGNETTMETLWIAARDPELNPDIAA